ncbi:MAG: Holliday junction branch migration protein RuvA [Eubacteriales bacterium]|nr:Holliday junction branch migration protein RuvA [Eubacteriales bacterium]
MISYIKGELTEVFEDMIVLENQNIGYNIKVPASVIDKMPRVGREVRVYTYLYVREDAVNLFGFLTRDDLNIFKMLLNVSGIGPKGALGILSAITPDDLRFAVLSDDVNTIKSCPGIGAKTAQKLIIELKDKISLEDTFETVMQNNNQGSLNSDAISIRDDAIQALVALGYSNKEAIAAVKRIDDIDKKDSGQVLKEALKQLAIL